MSLTSRGPSNCPTTDHQWKSCYNLSLFWIVDPVRFKRFTSDSNVISLHFLWIRDSQITSRAYYLITHFTASQCLCVGLLTTGLECRHRMMVGSRTYRQVHQRFNWFVIVECSIFSARFILNPAMYCTLVPLDCTATRCAIPKLNRLGSRGNICRMDIGLSFCSA